MRRMRGFAFGLLQPVLVLLVAAVASQDVHGAATVTGTTTVNGAAHSSTTTVATPTPLPTGDISAQLTESVTKMPTASTQSNFTHDQEQSNTPQSQRPAASVSTSQATTTVATSMPTTDLQPGVTNTPQTDLNPTTEIVRQTSAEMTSSTQTSTFPDVVPRTSAKPIDTSTGIETETVPAVNTLVIGDVPTTSSSGLSCPKLPVNSEIGICPITSQTCSSDAACKLGEVCCRKGCGRECVRGCPPLESCDRTCLDGYVLDKNNCTMCACEATPASPAVDTGKGGLIHKPRNGTCPEYKPSIGLCGKDMVVEICVFDDDCGSEQKCCRSGCGRSCVTPCFAPECDESCPQGHKLDQQSCATCQCVALEQEPATQPPVTSAQVQSSENSQTETPTSATNTSTSKPAYFRLVEIELEIVADNIGGYPALLLQNRPVLKRSLEGQLQSQLGLVPGQLKVLAVMAGQKRHHILVSLTITARNETGDSYVDSTVMLMSHRTRDGNLWLGHTNIDNGTYYKLRAVGILALGGKVSTGNQTRKTLAIVVAILGFFLLVIILSIIAFVNWRADRRKKLEVSGAQRHSSAVRYDGQDTTFTNPFVPNFIINN